jgi:hypothetical protein
MKMKVHDIRSYLTPSKTRSAIVKMVDPPMFLKEVASIPIPKGRSVFHVSLRREKKLSILESMIRKKEESAPRIKTRSKELQASASKRKSIIRKNVTKHVRSQISRGKSTLTKDLKMNRKHIPRTPKKGRNSIEPSKKVLLKKKTNPMKKVRPTTCKQRSLRGARQTKSSSLPKRIQIHIPLSERPLLRWAEDSPHELSSEGSSEEDSFATSTIDASEVFQNFMFPPLTRTTIDIGPEEVESMRPSIHQETETPRVTPPDSPIMQLLKDYLLSDD